MKEIIMSIIAATRMAVKPDCLSSLQGHVTSAVTSRSPGVFQLLFFGAGCVRRLSGTGSRKRKGVHEGDTMGPCRGLHLQVAILQYCNCLDNDMSQYMEDLLAVCCKPAGT